MHIPLTGTEGLLVEPIGKKTERLWLPRQLCVDPFLAARLRDRAARNSRKLEDEIRFLLMRALDSQDAQPVNSQKLTFPHMRG